MTTNAPVGPAIWTRDPPSTATISPATTAVQRPRSGVTPLAIANAMASGSATMPTTTPARRSFENWVRSYVASDVTSLGISTDRRDVLTVGGRFTGKLAAFHGAAHHSSSPNPFPR